MNREERLHRLEVAYYVARRAYIDADCDFYAAACAHYDLACMKRDTARTRMFDTARKLDGEIDYE